MASPVALSILGRRRSGPALPRLVVVVPFLALIAAAVLPSTCAADLTPPSAPFPAPSSLPGPADSPPSPPTSIGSIPSPAPAPQSSSDSPRPPNSPTSPPSSEPFPSPSPNTFPGPADAPSPPSASSASEKLHSNPQVEQQEQPVSDRGMSAGKKAGIAVSVLFITALAVTAFAVYRKRRDNVRRASRYAGFTNRREMQMV